MIEENVLKQFNILRQMKQLNLAEALNTIPHGELVILHELLRSSKENNTSEISISELAQRLGVSPPAVSRTLRKLEQKEYVQRITDKKDRRNTYVHVTEEGRTAFITSTNILTSFMTKVFSHLTQEEMTMYFNLSQKIYTAILAECEIHTAEECEI